MTRRPGERQHHDGYVWTDERTLAVLDAIHVEGLSCGAIAKREGVTRNAIIGLSGRIRIAMKDTPMDAHDGTMPTGWWRR